MPASPSDATTLDWECELKTLFRDKIAAVVPPSAERLPGRMKLTAGIRRLVTGGPPGGRNSGANTQGATLEEARENLKDALRMVLEANRELSEGNRKQLGARTWWLLETRKSGKIPTVSSRF